MSPLNKHETGSDAGLPRYGDVEQFQLADAGTGREETEEPLLAAGTTNDKEQQHQHQYGQGHYGQSGISDQPAMLPARRSRRRQQRRFAWGTISESHVRIVSRWLLRIISIYLATTTIVFLCFDYLFAATNVVLPRQPYRRVRKAMLVVAHPDDECLFFSPTLGTLSSRLQDAPRSSSSSSDTLDDQQQLSILVMSSGNNYGLGDVRGKELLGSCAQFNVPEERCVHLDEPDIQDNPTVWWPTDRIASLIGKYADQWGIDTIFTFDDGGISGHINHRAVSASVQQYGDANPEKQIWLVYTTSTLRKYTVFFDFAWTALPTVLFRCIPFVTKSSPGYTLNTLGMWRTAVRAFQSHASQWEFARTLFLPTNRYMWYNELVLYQPGVAQQAAA